MTDLSFSLKPFSPTEILKEVEITGTISRRSDILGVHYALSGSLTNFDIPAPAAIPVRKDALWRETCFEFFLKGRGSDRYWEFNLSPSGHWNVYHFKAYRQEMQEEPSVLSLPFSVENISDALAIDLKFNLDAIGLKGQGIEVAVSAVIKRSDGRVTFWALIHPGSEPDFHRRDSFIIAI